MNPMLMLHEQLRGALVNDPLNALALLTATLDPFWQVEPADFDECEGDLEMALFIARRAFPDVYVEAIQCRHAGATDAELDKLICDGFTKHGIPLDDVNFLGYGIPLYACGINLTDPDSYTTHQDLLPVLDLFGICPEEDSRYVDVPHEAYTAGQYLADSLARQTDPAWQKVGWMLGWLFSCTGNSLIDLDDEGLSETPPLSWDADEIEFATGMIAEAEQILKDANAGLEFLTAQPERMQVLERNIERTLDAVSRLKNKNDKLALRLRWQRRVCYSLDGTPHSRMVPS